MNQRSRPIPRRRASRARHRFGEPPRHPTGPARRRWPRAYDGAEEEEVVPRRYRRAFEEEVEAKDRRRLVPQRTLDILRQSPIRNGLVGLAVAGTAAPIAVNRYQQALRTDPSHESVATHGLAATGEGDEDAVAKVWQELEDADANAAAARERSIQANLTRYASYGLDRALAEQIYDRAVENDIDPEVAFGLVRAESSFKNTSTSAVGAVGLTQLMPKTASWLQPGVTKSQLREPGTNLRIGFSYLRQLIDKYEGDEKLALLAYNRGPGTVDRELSRGRDPDNGYADFVYGREGHGHKLFTH